MKPGRVVRATCWWLTWSLALGAAGAAEDAAPAVEEATAAPEEDEYYDEYAVEVPEVSDPLEGLNRTMFKFNATVMKFVIRPVSRGYQTIVPRFARQGIGNFFDNLRFPIRLTSNVLQGKADRAGAETGKFLLNSTVGLGGLIKVSDSIPSLQVPMEDTGQAFGKWGVKHGPFLVLPVLGPSSTRDVVGRLGDAALYPLNWNLLDDYAWEVEAGLRTADTLDTLSGAVEVYDALNQAALDPYIAFRNAYLQSRDAAVNR